MGSPVGLSTCAFRPKLWINSRANRPAKSAGWRCRSESASVEFICTRGPELPHLLAISQPCIPLIRCWPKVGRFQDWGRSHWACWCKPSFVKTHEYWILSTHTHNSCHLCWFRKILCKLSWKSNRTLILATGQHVFCFKDVDMFAQIGTYLSYLCHISVLICININIWMSYGGGLHHWCDSDISVSVTVDVAVWSNLGQVVLPKGQGSLARDKCHRLG